ncbi:hypothetical protein ABZV15_34325 [Streptomyces sp. NPDC005246]|uniref:hypothetical protein n=1 Tax=Streptomyces sp. NPDC005246 TaxID=3156716 RepID=UPI0033B28BD6
MPFSTAIRGRARQFTVATSIVVAVGAGVLAPAAIALSSRPGTPTAGVTAAADTRGIDATHDHSRAFETVDADGVPIGNQNVRVCTDTRTVVPFTHATETVVLPTDHRGKGALPAGHGGGIGAGDGCIEADCGGEHRHERRHGDAG